MHVIDDDHAGMPGIAHGGHVAGLLTEALGAEATRLRLHRPVPTAQPLRTVRPAPGVIELHGDAGLLAEAVAADVLLDVPEPVAPAEALRAGRRHPPAARHPFPGCWCCGPAHPRGLGVHPGPVGGRRVAAALWTPPAVGGDAAIACAALDCPALWALMLDAPVGSNERVVTEILETRLERPVTAGEPHVVMAWPAGRDGRRRLAGAAIFGPDGELCAAGRQVAVAVRGWGVPLGRDHWRSATPVATP
jgi:hypothetical protein